MKIRKLMESWQLRDEMLSCGPDQAAFVEQKTDGWMEVPSLPCDVHMALMAYGRIEEPLEGLNTENCEWVERRSWWFKKTFAMEASDLAHSGAELFIEILDIHADIFLNGAFLGHHPSAFYPFRKDVLPYLKEGENTLLIRLTCGLETVDMKELEPIRDFISCEWRRRRPGRGEEKRVMLRKPQYEYGWDMAPRLATCAVAGDVRIDLVDEVVVRDVRFETLALTEEGAKILAEATVDCRENDGPDCAVTYTLSIGGEIVHTETKDVLLQAGNNYLDFSFTLADPKLWWPNGYGEHPLYTASVTAVNERGARDEKTITTGIRTVKLDTSKTEDGERQYAFLINGKKIYCKGMVLIHTDCIYARAKNELYEKLLTAAKDAHFNMIRLWSGGFCYARDFVYEFCDRNGIMIRQNFGFECSTYPDHLMWFRELVSKEALYQTRRLRSHPSIVLWCANGECLGFQDHYLGRNMYDETHPAIHPGGRELWGKVLPEAHRANVMSVPYQCSTPFGGDSHLYPFLIIDPAYQQTRISFEVIDTLDAKFLVEGGIMGPPSKKALVRYLGGAEDTEYGSRMFLHHRNTFEKDAVRDGIYRHYTGERELSLGEYCRYGGLFQSSLLEYEADHFRAIEKCSGCVMWCFSDGFGEVGFSAMDHYGNPKPGYYALRRAFSASRLIVKRRGDRAAVFCSNDTEKPRTVRVRAGYVTYGGEYGPAVTFKAEIPAFTKLAELGSIPLCGLDLRAGTVYAKAEEADIQTAVMHTGDFRTLRIPKKASLAISDVVKEGGKLSFTVTADVYAHGVSFGLDEEYLHSDLFFDLLPGESRRITVSDAEALTAPDLKPDCAEPVC